LGLIYINYDCADCNAREEATMPMIFPLGDGRLNQIETILKHCKGGHITEQEAEKAIYIIVRDESIQPPVSVIKPPLVGDEFGTICPN